MAHWYKGSYGAAAHRLIKFSVVSTEKSFSDTAPARAKAGRVKKTDITKTIALFFTMKPPLLEFCGFIRAAHKPESLNPFLSDLRAVDLGADQDI
jgi:hypothetical protein